MWQIFRILLPLIQELQEAVDDCYNLNGWALPKKDICN
jgi:hypothetical protein